MRRDSPLDTRLASRLARWDADGLRRRLEPPAGIDLSSNDYLGLAHDARLIAALQAASAREGVGSTGSRLLRGQRAVFEAVEQRFARFKGTEQALYFSSGYLANLAVLSTLTDAGDVIFSDALNHASVIDGIRLSRARCVVFPHLDLQALGAALEREACQGLRFVVVESLFSMDGDEAPLEALAALCERTGAVLIVDEAHAVGVYGPRGSGLIEASGVDGAVTVSINTAGKALGVAGAFVAGSERVVEYLVQRGRPFVFSTAPPPALADAVAESLTIVEQEPERRQKLWSNVTFLRARLRQIGVTTSDARSQIVSVPIGDNRKAVEVADRLRRGGFDVRAIRPPTVPPGTARLRVSVSAGLSHVVLERFTAALVEALAQVDPCCAVSS